MALHKSVSVGQSLVAFFYLSRLQASAPPACPIRRLHSSLLQGPNSSDLVLLQSLLAQCVTFPVVCADKAGR